MTSTLATPSATPAVLPRRQLLASTALMLGASGCGYLLYPGRNGRRGGKVDPLILVIDLLWLLPGLVPGIICLAVDFTTGCIYGGGERAQTSSPPGTDASHMATVEVELDGEVVAVGQLEPDRKAALTWKRSVDEATLRERARVLVRTPGGALAQADVRALL